MFWIDWVDELGRRTFLGVQTQAQSNNKISATDVGSNRALDLETICFCFSFLAKLSWIDARAADVDLVKS